MTSTPMCHPRDGAVLLHALLSGTGTLWACRRKRPSSARTTPCPPHPAMSHPQLRAVQANNVVVKTSQQPARQEDGLFNHVDLVQMLDIVDMENGTTVAGEGSAAFEMWITP